MFKKISIFLCLAIPSVTGAMDATYYSDSFEGAPTAYGNVFSQTHHSAAICNEELGQLAYVSRAQTGMMVVLDDRPNCSRFPDLLDLSRSAFSVFASPTTGRVSDVSVRPMGIEVGDFSKRNLSQDEFHTLSVELNRPLSNTYIAGESIRVSGRAIGNDTYVMSYLENKKTGKKYSQSYRTSSGGRFDFVLSFPPDVGEYYFVVAAGTSFHLYDPPSILLVPGGIEHTIGYGVPTSRLSSIVLRPISLGSESVLTIPDGLWGELSITRDTELHLTGSVFRFPSGTISRGVATYVFTGYTLSTPSSLDRSPIATHTARGQIFIDRTHASIGADRVRALVRGRELEIRFQIPVGKKIQTEYYLTLPSGDVRVYSFAESYVDPVSGYLKTGVPIRATLPVEALGTYMLETLEHDGFAYYNIPIVRGKVWNIVSPLSDADIRNIKKSPSNVRDTSYAAINQLRIMLGRPLLGRDPILDRLAQAKADNMSEQRYVGHTTPDGKNIREFAVTLGINLSETLGENVAGGNVSGAALQDGLEESGSHRANMIDPGWKKVGIGYTVRDGQTYMVQIFSD